MKIIESMLVVYFMEVIAMTAVTLISSIYIPYEDTLLHFYLSGQFRTSKLQDALELNKKICIMLELILAWFNPIIVILYWIAELLRIIFRRR